VKAAGVPAFGAGVCTGSKLKGARLDAEEPGMFLRRREPILLTEEGIDGLCASLNRPVVDVEGLPVGPASSAIVLHRSAAGERGVAVAVRSEDSGAVVLFVLQGEPGAGAAQAMDAGLAFAEGMGFLFDEDVLAAGLPTGRRQAMEIWCHLTGDDLPAEDVFDTGGLDEDLMLDEVLDLDDALELTPPGAATLSKFRRPAAARAAAAPEPLEAAPPSPEDGNAAQLGRIPIVRRRRSDDADPESPPLLMRLLARF